MQSAGTFIGRQADGPLAGWPLVADGQGGTIVASPTGTCWNRGHVDPSTLDAAGCWAAVDRYYASKVGRAHLAEHRAKRAAERAAQLAEFNRGQLLR